MGIVAAVMSGFVLAALAPWLVRTAGRGSGWLFALLPLGLTAYFADRLVKLLRGASFPVEGFAWYPQLGVEFTFQTDGLALFFALLISGIGTLVLIYAGGYLAGHPQLGRFFLYLLAFMASMLGVVLADNLFSLFVFWELTSISSYFLIGFDHERDAARAASLQALLVTASGGLALLAGLVLLGHAGGSASLAELIATAGTVQEHALYLPILLLVLAGAVTKSAQFPFHVWLPNAMEAPTPVSAYLHSSTMVKAGVYLLARLSPVLGGTVEWQTLVTAFGAVTMVVGAYLAFRETYLKRILAYSTVSSLGSLVMLLGLGTEQAVTAAVVFLLAHALYKATLFLVAGAIDHETGERDAERVGGLGRAMPVTALAALLAAVSMAGLPPFFGFLGKEESLRAVWESPIAALGLTAASVAGGALTVAVAVLAGVRPFAGPRMPTPRQPHEAPVALWLGPLLLASLGLAAGLWPGLAGEWLLAPVASSVLAEPVRLKLVLWHGIDEPLILGSAAIALGLIVFAMRSTLRRGFSRLDPVAALGPAAWYQGVLTGMLAVARGQTRLLQHGYLRYYLMTVVLATAGLVTYLLLTRDVAMQPRLDRDVRFYEAGVAMLIVLAAIAAVCSHSRLGAIAAMGVVGFGMTLLFALFGAPDLAMTQFVIETLTVILFVLVFYRLPPFATWSSRPARFRDLLVALTLGGVMTALVLVANEVQLAEPVSSYFLEHSLPEAHGRNVVNVILVDFRAMDTLGEITVLALAAVGVFALLKLRGAGSGTRAAGD